MLIVFSSETDLPHEAHLINSLFGEGLERFHLRKPAGSKEDYKRLLDNFNPQYHKQISVHDFHELKDEYKLGGIHFKENHRKNMNATIDDFDDLITSTSFHLKEDVIQEGRSFDYCFLSPVFDSISKQGYEGKSFEVHGIDQRVIALGGIHQKNIHSTIDMGFSGAAVLGAIWKSDNPVKEFTELRNAYLQVA